MENGHKAYTNVEFGVFYYHHEQTLSPATLKLPVWMLSAIWDAMAPMLRIYVNIAILFSYMDPRVIHLGNSRHLALWVTTAGQPRLLLITDSQSDFLQACVTLVSTVTADGLGPPRSRISGGTGLNKSEYKMYTIT